MKPIWFAALVKMPSLDIQVWFQKKIQFGQKAKVPLSLIQTNPTSLHAVLSIYRVFDNSSSIFLRAKLRNAQSMLQQIRNFVNMNKVLTKRLNIQRLKNRPHSLSPFFRDIHHFPRIHMSATMPQMHHAAIPVLAGLLPRVAYQYKSDPRISRFFATPEELHSSTSRSFTIFDEPTKSLDLMSNSFELAKIPWMRFDSIVT